MFMRDRLLEVKGSFAMDPKDRMKSQCSTTLDPFDEKFKNLESSIEKLESLTKNISFLQSEMVSSAIMDDQKKKELSSCNNQFLNILSSTNKMIRECHELVEADSGDTSKTTIFTVRKNQCRAINRKLDFYLREYKKGQHAHREKCKSQMRTAYSLCGKNITDDEIEDMIQKNNFNEMMNQFQQNENLQRSLVELEDRQKFLMELETNMLAVRDIAAYIDTLVEQQGQILDIIENNASNSHEYVKKAAASIQEAVILHKSFLKKKWIIIGIVVLIVVVIIIILAVTLS